MSIDTRNYYQILEISKSASQEEIKKAYKRLALKYHPDKNPGGEAQFKEVSEAYEVLSNPATRAEYDKNPNQPRTSRGGIGASYDWRTEVWHSIREAFDKNNVRSDDLGSEYLNLFGHSECQGLSQMFKGDYFIHIVICLDSMSEAENFKNQVLAVINNYASKINQLKEEVIRRIEKYANDNLNEESKEVFYQESYDGLVKGGKRCDWRETLRFNNCYCNEKMILEFEEGRKELVDTLKAIDERTSKGLKNDEERKREYEKLYQNWQNKFQRFFSWKRLFRLQKPS